MLTLLLIKPITVISRDMIQPLLTGSIFVS